MSFKVNSLDLVEYLNNLAISKSRLAEISSGKLYTYGSNFFGDLGLLDTINRSSPVQVTLTNDWKQIQLNNSTCNAVKGDGTLWAWGYGGEYQTGPAATNKSYPTQMGTDTNWKVTTYGLAIKTNGTLWAWGWNQFGKLGLGDTANKTTIIQVGTSLWSQVDSCASQTVGIKTDGTLWSWGNNINGQLGLGDTVNRSTPTQIGALTNWYQTVTDGTATYSIKTDGTLWAWGDNSVGQLGDGTLVPKSSPIQIGSSNQWKQITCGGQWVIALKTDGTLWSWGANNFGELGLGDITSRSSPVQIGSLTTWDSVSTSNDRHASNAIKTDGTLWSWGRNDQGTMGDGTLVSKSSPVQIGSYTDWKFSGIKQAYPIRYGIN